MTRFIWFAAILLVIGTDNAVAQGCFDVDRWWKIFEIRKAFDGGSAEAEPANLGLVSPGAESKAYWFLDGGIRTRPCESRIKGTLLIWFPSVEWHHMSAEPLQEQDATNKGGGGFNAEWWFGSGAVQPYLVSKAGVKRDVLNDTTEGEGTLLVSVVGTNGLRPSTPISVNGYRRAVYYPYAGVQYFRNLAITQGEDVVAPQFDGAATVVRLQYELTPFHHQTIPGQIPFVITGEYAYRRLFKDAPTLESRNLNFFNIAANWYFDDEQQVGIALTLDKGRSPETNFVSQQRATIGLAIKR